MTPKTLRGHITLDQLRSLLSELVAGGARVVGLVYLRGHAHLQVKPADGEGLLELARRHGLTIEAT